MKFFRKASVFLLGLTFFMSGVFKLMDPVGATFVVRAWLGFLHLSFLGFFARLLALAFAFFESFLGAALLARVWKRTVATAAFILTGFFTILTLLLVIFNPEMDCGCFGEVVHLTHWQSLVKNVLLLGLCCAAFLPFRKLSPRAGRIKYVSFAVAAVSAVLFSIYSTLSIPLVDYGSFKPGTELLRGEAGDPGSADVEAAAVPSPFDAQLSFFDFNLDYRDSLATSGDVMVLSVYDPERLPDSYWAGLPEFLEKCSRSGLGTLVLVCADPDEFAGKVKDARVLSNVYFADYKTLATLNRSNGGAVAVRDAQIVRKWSRRSLPDSGTLSEMMSVEATAYQMRHTRSGSVRLQAFWLYSAAVLLLL